MMHLHVRCMQAAKKNVINSSLVEGHKCINVLS